MDGMAGSIRWGIVGFIAACIGGAGVLWPAPWWAKLVVPLVWGLHRMLASQIAAVAEIAASANGNRD